MSAVRGGGGRLRRRDPRRGAAAASAAVLRRVDREPRAAHLSAARPGLPRLRRRGRHGPRPRGRGGARAADQEGGQRDRERGRRPRDPPGQRARRRLLPRAARRPSSRPGRGARTRARRRDRDRPVGRRASTSPTSSSDYEFVALVHAGRVRDRARAALLLRRPGHRRRGVRGARRPRSTSRTRPRCTPACATATTLPAGPLARYSLNCDRLSDVARDAAAAAGLGATCRNPFQSIVVRSVEVLYALDEALRLIERLRARRTRRPSRSRRARVRARR